MEIQIASKDEKSIIRILFKCGDAGEYWYEFSHDLSHKSVAGLVSSEIREQLEETMRSIREQAYNQGWDDHKKRRTRKVYFARSAKVVPQAGY